MTAFESLGDVNLLALTNNNKAQDVVNKKQDILDNLAQYYNLSPTKILFVGFSSFVLADVAEEITITAISDDVKSYLTKQNVKYKYIPEVEMLDYRKQFEVVVAVDEFFTYADSDSTQKDLVAQICNLATDYVMVNLTEQVYAQRQMIKDIH